MVIQFSLEMMKMMIQPLRNSRGVVELIDDFQEQLQVAAMQAPPQPPMPPPGAQPPGAGPPVGLGSPPGGPPMPPPGMNGAGPPPPM
jgi:hypothetical protein